MAKYLYNGIELPALPTWDSATYPAAAIARCLSDEAISIYGGEYALVFGTRPQWNNGNLYMYGFHGLYYASGDEWVYQFGSGTSDVLDIAVADFIEVKWTNTDIATEDGTGVFLAASDPVLKGESDEEEPATGMTDNMKSFIKMLLCGLVSKGAVKESEKTPIAYSYNGVVLPDINTVWTDKETYPYAYISNPYGNVAGYCLGLATATGYVDFYSDSSTELDLKFDGMCFVEWYQLTADLTAWEYLMTANVDEGETKGLEVAADLVWTSFDIVNITDDTTYLAASEPVPVYGGDS